MPKPRNMAGGIRIDGRLVVNFLFCMIEIGHGLNRLAAREDKPGIGVVELPYLCIRLIVT